MGDGADGIDMDTDPVAAAGRRLQSSGELLGADWHALHPRLLAGAGIGTGRLADAFRGTYTDQAMTACSNADPYPGRISGLGTATTGGSVTYSVTDGMVHDAFQRLLQGGG